MIRWFGALVLFSMWAICTYAGEIVPQVVIDGKVYRDVRWGPVNQGSVVIFHSRGIKVVPLDKLPSEYQAYFGNQPTANPAPSPTPPPPVQPVQPVTPPPTPTPPPITVMPPLRPPTERDPDWEAYNKDRKTKLALRKKLVNRSSLTSLVGFIGSQVRTSDGNTMVRGVVLELASRKTNGNSSPTEFSLRPNLWERNGEKVLLRNYVPQVDPGMLVHVYVLADTDIDDYKTYEVAIEPSYEQWKQLRFASSALP